MVSHKVNCWPNNRSRRPCECITHWVIFSTKLNSHEYDMCIFQQQFNANNMLHLFSLIVLWIMIKCIMHDGVCFCPTDERVVLFCLLYDEKTWKFVPWNTFIPNLFVLLSGSPMIFIYVRKWNLIHVHASVYDSKPILYKLVFSSVVSIV